MTPQLARLGTPAVILHRATHAIHAVAPHDDDDAWTLFTIGHAGGELVMRLPEDWEFRETTWPVRWLDTLANLPVALSLGDTIPNGDPPQPIAPGTELCCMLLVVPTFLDDADTVIAVMPIYREEMQLKLSAGVDALIARLDDADLDETIDLARRNVGVSHPAKIRPSKRR